MDIIYYICKGSSRKIHTDKKKKKLKKTNSYIKWIGTRELKKKLFNKYLIKIKYLNYFK